MQPRVMENKPIKYIYPVIILPIPLVLYHYFMGKVATYDKQLKCIRGVLYIENLEAIFLQHQSVAFRV